MFDKFDLPKIEEEILNFWEENKIFEKSLKNRAKAKRFRFYEGPPYANGLPGIHHILSRSFKDIILRFKSMQGFLVERKAGWDTHGLPTEMEVEKKLNIKNKREIENSFGIKRFIEECKKNIFTYIKEWEIFTKRIGYWIDLKNAYITCTTKYIETLWWILKQIWNKKLLEKKYKVVPHCPHCETTLSSHEIAQGYKKVRENSVYIKFKIKNANNTFILVWTTTPWTLPANVALAVGVFIDYVKVRIKSNGENLILAKSRLGVVKEEYEIIDEFKGESLIHLIYEPLYQIDKYQQNDFKVYPADFVSTEDGTGIVHIAPAFGEEDYQLGVKYNLSTVFGVDLEGRIIADVPGKGLFIKEADKLIIEDLKKRNLLYQTELYEHDYPFCWRCGSPLLYYAKSSWFIKMTKIKNKMIENSKKINWVPEYIKEGRFGDWLKDLRDWAISRERYWGAPIPIWQCQNCGFYECIGSIEELKNKSYGSGNKYYFLRHGEADHILEDLNTGWLEFKNPAMISRLTKKGKRQIKEAANVLKKKGGVDLIFSSDLVRAKETATIVSEIVKTPVIYDERLREYNVGIFSGKAIKEHKNYYKGDKLKEFSEAAPEGESLTDVKKRMMSFLLELEKKYQNKRILVVGHGDPLWVAEGGLLGLSDEEILNYPYIGIGELREMKYKPLPFNDNFELDLHRPYIDEIKLKCRKCGSKMERILEIADVWFDSGAMPFAQWHYPFENRDKIDKKISFPADFISEGIDQTRGWFYTLLAVSTLLNKGPSFLNVICHNLILDEKGQKMSKSKGNVIKPDYIINKYGIDAFRWYLYNINSEGDTKFFNEKHLLERYRRFLMTIWNCFTFYKTYAPKKIKKPLKISFLDKWILSKLANVSISVAEKLDKYHITDASRDLDSFVDDLSNWYIRRSRRRFQKPESKNELNTASYVLNKVLNDLSKLIAPFTPFFADYLYRNLDKKKESVHLENWPKFKKSYIDIKLEKEMNLVREISAAFLALRASAGIKVRQPLLIAQLKIKDKKLRIKNDLLNLVKDEINVKKIEISDVRKEGQNWKKKNFNEFEIALNLEITSELREEGILRDIIRQIQEMRKEAGLKPYHLATLFFDGDRDFIKKNSKVIKAECLIKNISPKPLPNPLVERSIEIDNRKFSLAIAF